VTQQQQQPPANISDRQQRITLARSAPTGGYVRPEKRTVGPRCDQGAGPLAAINPGETGALTVTHVSPFRRSGHMKGPDCLDSQADSPGSIPVTRSRTLIRRPAGGTAKARRADAAPGSLDCAFRRIPTGITPGSSLARSARCHIRLKLSSRRERRRDRNHSRPHPHHHHPGRRTRLHAGHGELRQQPPAVGSQAPADTDSTHPRAASRLSA
jgi:hypothetical protein